MQMYRWVLDRSNECLQIGYLVYTRVYIHLQIFGLAQGHGGEGRSGPYPPTET